MWNITKCDIKVSYFKPYIERVFRCIDEREIDETEIKESLHSERVEYDGMEKYNL